MIPLLLGQIIHSTEALLQLSHLPLKASLSFRIARLTRQLDKVMSFWAETRQKLLSKYGYQDDQGSWTFDSAQKIEFDRELNEVMNEEILIDIPAIQIIELEDAPIEPKHLRVLDWLIKE